MNRSMIPTKTVKDLGLEKAIGHSDNRYSVKNASSDKMKVIGSIHLFLHVEGALQPKRIHFIIADDLLEILVSLGVLPTNFPAYLNAEEAFQTKVDTQIQEEEKATEDPSLMNFE